MLVKTKKAADKKKKRHAKNKAPARSIPRPVAKKLAAPRAQKRARAGKVPVLRGRKGPGKVAFKIKKKKAGRLTVIRKAVPRVAAEKPASLKKTGDGVEKACAPVIRVGQEPAMGPKYFFSTDIPGTYDETYMRALPRDPLWLFAYWEVSGETIELMRRHVGADVFNRSKWVLRVLDVSDIFYDGTNAWRQMDIDLAPYASNWYVKVWEAGRTYMLQCGIVTPDSKFYSAVNSNAVPMPRAGVSPVLDEEWMTASTDELIRLSGLKRGFGSSENSSRFSSAGLASGSGSGSGSIL
jgi:hypothetical protein